MNKSLPTVRHGKDGAEYKVKERCPSTGVHETSGVEMKQLIAQELNRLLDHLRISQTAIAERLGIKQPHVSAIRNNKLDGFSSERLLELLVKLGSSITIAITPAKATDSGGITVKPVQFPFFEKKYFHIEIYSDPVGKAVIWGGGSTEPRSTCTNWMRGIETVTKPHTGLTKWGMVFEHTACDFKPLRPLHAEPSDDDVSVALSGSWIFADR